MAKNDMFDQEDLEQEETLSVIMFHTEPITIR